MAPALMDPALTDSARRYRALIEARPGLARNLPGGIDVILDPAETRRIEAAMAGHFAAQGLPREWARAGVFYEDPYIILLRDAVLFPDGRPGLYHRVIARHDEPTGVAILARYRGDFVLLRHFRHPSRAWHLEIPRGAVDAGDDPTEVAHVEISEEIGGTISSLLRLGLLYGASALMRHSVVLVYAELEAIGTPALGEGIAEIVLVAPGEIERLVADGLLTDAFTVAAIYHARLRGLLGC
jgi:ADP-ribose diphosphatase